MNEQEIFGEALEIENRQERAAFLDQACGRDAQLRQHVEALLAEHERSGDFLNVPILEQIVGDGDSKAAVPETILGDSQIEKSSEKEFLKFLEPSTRPGWLGRLGHYEIEEILGRGAFGIVAKGFDEKLHRVVAIKMLSPELATISPPRKRFLREARSAAAVTHENIVAIYAVEESPIPYLVMEYVAGQTLQDRMDQSGPLEINDILRISQQIAAGLAAAHASQLIHRDIKPSNILMSGGPIDRVKISDFGLARTADDASLTTSGLIAGTPMYMAPEQARGEPLDHRADLFSLGSVMYQMVGGRPPFRASNTIAILKRVCDDDPRPLKDVIPPTPAWLETIIFKLLKKERNERYQTAQEVAQLLAQCESELQTKGTVTCVTVDSEAGKQEPSTTNRANLRGKLVWLLAAATVVAAIVIGVAMKSESWNDSLAVVTKSTDAPTPQYGFEAAEEVAEKSPDAAGWHGWPVDAPRPAIAPFDAKQAKELQNAWARYLSVPVEFTNSQGMRFRLIPPGEFEMGSAPAEIEAPLQAAGSIEVLHEYINSESPPQRVILTQPIYVGAYEVTQREYLALLGTNPSFYSSWNADLGDGARFSTEGRPVEMVSWDDAVKFCAALNRKEGLNAFAFSGDAPITPHVGASYRLATEAEWEFACRAGTTTPFWCGDSDEELARVAWYGKLGGEGTHDVGQLPPNPFGLHDMHGNVWEYVADAWDPAYYQQIASKPAIDPVGPPFENHLQRVKRGGGWFTPTLNCRSAYRNANVTTATGLGIGFRVVLAMGDFHQSRQAVPQQIFAARDWKPTPKQQAFFTNVAPLPAAQQVEEVTKKLQELNPDFDGKVESRIDDDKVTKLKFLTDHVTEIWPLRALTELQELDCSGNWFRQGQLADIAPLAGMKLRSLAFSSTQVDDLTPLRGMPLKTLNCDHTLVSTLFPLTGMKLEEFIGGGTKVSDLSPLSDMPLKTLNIGGNTSISDLSALHDLKLTHLECANSNISDLSPLIGVPLEYLNISDSTVSDLSPLKELHLKTLIDNANLTNDFSTLKNISVDDLVIDVPLYAPETEALLRSLPLKKLNNQGFGGMPVEKFWSEQDRRRQAAQEFVDATSPLPPDQQVAAIRERLTELNGQNSFDLQHVVPSGSVSEVTIDHGWNLDLTPLLALSDLKRLTLKHYTRYGEDLSFLSKMEVEELICSEANVFKNLPTLQGLSSLRRIELLGPSRSLASLQQALPHCEVIAK